MPRHSTSALLLLGGLVFFLPVLAGVGIAAGANEEIGCRCHGGHAAHDDGQERLLEKLDDLESRVQAKRDIPPPPAAIPPQPPALTGPA